LRFTRGTAAAGDIPAGADGITGAGTYVPGRDREGEPWTRLTWEQT
jgi:hypothetical protein